VLQFIQDLPKFDFMQELAGRANQSRSRGELQYNSFVPETGATHIVV